MAVPNLFLLSYGDPDDSTDGTITRYLIGPETVTEVEFTKLCDSLFALATERALTKARQEPEFILKVDMFAVMTEMLPLLNEHGFKEFTPKEVDYTGCAEFTDPNQHERIRALMGDHYEKVRQNNEMVDMQLTVELSKLHFNNDLEAANRLLRSLREST